MGSKVKLVLMMILSMAVRGYSAWFGQAIFIRNEMKVKTINLHCHSDRKDDLEPQNLKPGESLNWVFNPCFFGTTFTCEIRFDKICNSFDVFNGNAPTFPCIENYWRIKRKGIHYYRNCRMKGIESSWLHWYKYNANTDTADLIERIGNEIPEDQEDSNGSNDDPQSGDDSAVPKNKNIQSSSSNSSKSTLPGLKGMDFNSGKTNNRTRSSNSSESAAINLKGMHFDPMNNKTSSSNSSDSGSTMSGFSATDSDPGLRLTSRLVMWISAKNMYTK